MTGVTIIVPCWNEGRNIPDLVTALRGVAPEMGPESRVLFIDDGSSDDTWRAIERAAQEFPQEDGRDFCVTGIRLLEHVGKGITQAVGLRHASDAGIVVLMDGDGQHPVGALPEITRRVTESNVAVVATRLGYSRGIVPAFGTAGLRLLMKVLGSPFDPNLSEFLAVPYPATVALSRSPQLGIAPIVPLVQRVSPSYQTIPVEIQPRLTAGEKSRWTFTDLWRKALLQLLADPWSLLPRITLLAVAAFLFLLFAAVAAGINAVVQGTSPGTVAILGAVVVLAAISVGMWVASIVVSVVTLRLIDSRVQVDNFYTTT